MLKDLGLPTLQDRCRQHRLIFLYNIIEGHLSAIQAEKYLTPLRGKRRINPTEKEDHISRNAVDHLARNNSRCYNIDFGKTDTYRYSFFPRTVRDWNSQDETTATAGSVEEFKHLLHSAQSQH
eukprot:TRINITY_DN16744_c1_g1_i8.p2 TRINITY_DN16744_c1_g1~~TRINITY_DN16744_c1_g1_i8.p2  ORF type:complete len:123 (-),score=30.62 TRINITY_DN16744_c1_g1_i8:74-442(-)